MNISIEGNELIVTKIIALLRAIPDIKIKTQKKTLMQEFIPNAQTRKAIEDAATGNGCKSYKNSAEMFKSLGINV